ncbi:hypothetical protein ACFSIL_18560, partial [Streptosporangium lutulentum]
PRTPASAAPEPGHKASAGRGQGRKSVRGWRSETPLPARPSHALAAPGGKEGRGSQEERHRERRRTPKVTARPGAVESARSPRAEETRSAPPPNARTVPSERARATPDAKAGTGPSARARTAPPANAGPRSSQAPAAPRARVPAPAGGNESRAADGGAAYACRHLSPGDWRYAYCVQVWNNYSRRSGTP